MKHPFLGLRRSHGTYLDIPFVTDVTDNDGMLVDSRNVWCQINHYAEVIVFDNVHNQGRAHFFTEQYSDD